MQVQEHEDEVPPPQSLVPERVPGRVRQDEIVDLLDDQRRQSTRLATSAPPRPQGQLVIEPPQAFEQFASRHQAPSRACDQEALAGTGTELAGDAPGLITAG